MYLSVSVVRGHRGRPKGGVRVPHFYVDKQAQVNGDHEVHTMGCASMPRDENLVDLHDHDQCSTAIMAARRYYLQVNGCLSCAPDCHTR